MEDKTKKVLAGAAIGGVAVGLAVAGIAYGKIKKSNAEQAKLSSDVASLNNALKVAEASAQTKEQAVQEMNAKLAELGTQMVDFKTQLTAKDQQVLDLTAKLNAELANTPAPTNTGATSTSTETTPATTSGYIIDDIALSGNFGKTLRDDKLSILADAQVEFKDKDYAYEEQIVITSDFKPLVSAVNDEDFGATLYAGSSVRDFLQYKIVFKEDLNFSQITSDDSLKITMLGKPIEIIDADATAITYQQAKEYIALVGEEFEGVKVVNVGETSAIFQKGADIKVIKVGDEATLGDVKVKVSSVFYESTKTERMVVFETGSKITKTVKDGEALTLFGEVDDDNDALYVWTIDTANGVIGTRINQRFIDIDADEEFKALKAGEQLVLPNDYAAVTFLGATTPGYSKIKASFTDITIGAADTDVIKLSSDKTNFVADKLNYDTVYLNGTDMYVDAEDGYKKITTGITIEQSDDSTLSVTSTGTGFAIGNIAVTANYSALDLTAVKVGATDFSTRDNDVLTTRGDIIYDAEQSIEDDEIVFGIAAEAVTAKIKVN